MYVAEDWEVNRNNRNKLLAIEMCFLLRSCRRTKLDRLGKEMLREMRELEKKTIDGVKKRQLICFGHTKRMYETK